jgi:hypothetical protein
VRAGESPHGAPYGCAADRAHRVLRGRSPGRLAALAPCGGGGVNGGWGGVGGGRRAGESVDFAVLGYAITSMEDRGSYPPGPAAPPGLRTPARGCVGRHRWRRWSRLSRRPSLHLAQPRRGRAYVPPRSHLPPGPPSALAGQRCSARPCTCFTPRPARPGPGPRRRAWPQSGPNAWPPGLDPSNRVVTAGDDPAGLAMARGLPALAARRNLSISCCATFRAGPFAYGRRSPVALAQGRSLLWP